MMTISTEEAYRLRIWFSAAKLAGWVEPEDAALAARLEEETGR